jgi:hypothetical protein
MTGDPHVCLLAVSFVSSLCILHCCVITCNVNCHPLVRVSGEATLRCFSPLCACSAVTDCGASACLAASADHTLLQGAGWLWQQAQQKQEQEQGPQAQQEQKQV